MESDQSPSKFVQNQQQNPTQMGTAKKILIIFGFLIFFGVQFMIAFFSSILLVCGGEGTSTQCAAWGNITMWLFVAIYLICDVILLLRIFKGAEYIKKRLLIISIIVIVLVPLLALVIGVITRTPSSTVYSQPSPKISLTNSPSPGAELQTVPAEWQVCQIDSDCVVTEEECCGLQTSINKQFLETWLARRVDEDSGICKQKNGDFVLCPHESKTLGHGSCQYLICKFVPD